MHGHGTMIWRNGNSCWAAAVDSCAWRVCVVSLGAEIYTGEWVDAWIAMTPIRDLQLLDLALPWQTEDNYPHGAPGGLLNLHSDSFCQVLAPIPGSHWTTLTL